MSPHPPRVIDSEHLRAFRKANDALAKRNAHNDRLISRLEAENAEATEKRARRGVGK
jgi:hypothetical protein